MRARPVHRDGAGRVAPFAGQGAQLARRLALVGVGDPELDAAGGDDFGDDDDGESSPLDYGDSSADGTCTAIGVQPGMQTVCFDASAGTGGSSPAGYQDQCLGGTPGSPTGTTKVTVVAGKVTPGADIVLAAAGGVAGTVTHAGAGLAGAQVIVFNAANVHDFAGSTSTGAGGKYTIGGLTPGTVTVCFAAPGRHYQCWKNVAWNGDDDPPLAQATPVTVTAGAFSTGVDAALT